MNGEPQVSIENLQPMIAVTGRIVGREASAAVADVERVLARPGCCLPASAMNSAAFISSAPPLSVWSASSPPGLVARFILMLLLYERFALPAVVIGSALLATTAVFPGFGSRMSRSTSPP